MIRRWLSWPAAALVVLALAGGDAAAGPPRRNLVLITVDSLRADHLGC